MDKDIIRAMYVKAADQCKKGEAWEFEFAFAKILIDQCIYLAEQTQYDSISYPSDAIKDYFGVDQKETKPVMNADGTVENFMIKGFRCNCGCNVFHKPDDTNLKLYQCNACNQQYEAV